MSWTREHNRMREPINEVPSRSIRETIDEVACENSDCMIQIQGGILMYGAHGQCARNAALSRLLNVAELLEQILLWLPIEDLLLRVPRVCKVFKASVNNSISVRKQLFLEPDFAATYRVMPFRFYDQRLVSIPESTSGAFFFWISHPIFTKYCEKKSLMDTLVVQPPVRKMELRLERGSQYRVLKFDCMVTNPRGIRFRDLMNALEREFDVHLRRGFFPWIVRAFVRAWVPVEKERQYTC